MDGLKLFVLGEMYADPETWDGQTRNALVIAHDASEARSLVPEADGPTWEIEFDKPKVLLFGGNT
jgi:hypothetical protein